MRIGESDVTCTIFFILFLQIPCRRSGSTSLLLDHHHHYHHSFCIAKENTHEPSFHSHGIKFWNSAGEILRGISHPFGVKIQVFYFHSFYTLKSPPHDVVIASFSLLHGRYYNVVCPVCAVYILSYSHYYYCVCEDVNAIVSMDNFPHLH